MSCKHEIPASYFPFPLQIVLLILERRWHFDKQEERRRSARPWMSGIPHQLSSFKVHTMERWGESNPKHLSYVSWSHKLFVQVLGKTLAEGERAGEGAREEGWGEVAGGGGYQFMHYFPKESEHGLCRPSSRSSGRTKWRSRPANVKTLVHNTEADFSEHLQLRYVVVTAL